MPEPSTTTCTGSASSIPDARERIEARVGMAQAHRLALRASRASLAAIARRIGP